MAIQVGDKIPEVTLLTLDRQGTPSPVRTGELFRGRRAVLIAVPGAFTPTCSDHHLPGYVLRADELHAKGVDLIACTAVNDAYVMAAWGKARGAGDKVMMLADGNGELARAMGLEADLTRFGLGHRSRRYAAILEDGVVRALRVEQPGQLEVSTAEAVLAEL
ncbi:MAG TPA: peroxiredoxin [Thermoanaerobaculia bacterium]|jgi:peroxiredoxin